MQRQQKLRPCGALPGVQGLPRHYAVESNRSIIVERRHEIYFEVLRELFRDAFGSVQVFDVAGTIRMPTSRHYLSIDQLHFAKLPVVHGPLAEEECGLEVVLAG
jgi:hypothetical protein